MPVRSAKAHWEGDLQTGKGRVSLAHFDQPYNFNSRFKDGPGTNPEELMGASLAGCYAMALSGSLAGAGFTATSINATAKVSVDPDANGFSITGIVLEVEAKVPGIADAAFQQIAEATKGGCPVSRALKATPITLKAKLA